MRTENDTWTGMIGQLHRGEADVSPAGFTVTDERYIQGGLMRSETTSLFLQRKRNASFHLRRNYSINQLIHASKYELEPTKF